MTSAFHAPSIALGLHSDEVMVEDAINSGQAFTLSSSQIQGAPKAAAEEMEKRASLPAAFLELFAQIVYREKSQTAQ